MHHCSNAAYTQSEHQPTFSFLAIQMHVSRATILHHLSSTSGGYRNKAMGGGGGGGGGGAVILEGRHI